MRNSRDARRQPQDGAAQVGAAEHAAAVGYCCGEVRLAQGSSGQACPAQRRALQGCPAQVRTCRSRWPLRYELILHGRPCEVRWVNEGVLL